MRTLGISAVCAGLLSGCLSVTELRQSPPTRVATVSGRYLPVATCTMSRLQAMQNDDRVQYQFVDVSGAKTARILATARVPGGLFYTVPEPVFEVAFKTDDDGKVSVESRNGSGGHVVEQRVWPVVEACAGSPLTPAATPR